MARGSSGTARNGEGALLVSAVPPDLCLGYVNTLSWRGRRVPAETLQTISDVLGWIERAAVFSPGSVDHAAAWAQDNEAQAARTFAEAIELREALFGIFSAIGAAEACDRRDFLISSAALARAPQRCHRVPMQRRFAWSIARTRNPVRDAMTPVLWSAADLILRAASHRIRRCANEECLWLFLDQSKTNTRRWCDMGSCGNRAKSRRHYARAASSRIATPSRRRHGRAPASSHATLADAPAALGEITLAGFDRWPPLRDRLLPIDPPEFGLPFFLVRRNPSQGYRLRSKFANFDHRIIPMRSVIDFVFIRTNQARCRAPGAASGHRTARTSSHPLPLAT